MAGRFYRSAMRQQQELPALSRSIDRDFAMEYALGVARATGEGRYDLEFQRDLHHPQPRVWKSATAPEQISDWLADAEVDLQPGGHFRLRGQCEVDGQVLEVTAPSRLVWTWPHADHPESQVRITISPIADGQSRLTLVQTQLPQVHLLGVAAGWHTHLDALPAAILGRRTSFDPERAAQHFRRYQAAFGLQVP
jgi:uncharacterized protein YndB with AHSA1/START domain